MLRKIEEFLCRIGSDKYVHVLLSLMITVIAGKCIMLLSPCNQYLCAGLGAGVSLVFGGIKEVTDTHTGGDASWKDLLADCVGCLIGFVIIIIIH